MNEETRQKIDTMESLITAMTAVWCYARGTLTREECEAIVKEMAIPTNEPGVVGEIKDVAGTMNALAPALKAAAAELLARAR